MKEFTFVHILYDFKQQKTTKALKANNIVDVTSLWVVVGAEALKKKIKPDSSQSVKSGARAHNTENSQRSIGKSSRYGPQQLAGENL